MINQELFDYIKKAKEAGQTDEQIRLSLLAAGWPEKDISQALQDKKISFPDILTFFNRHKKPAIISAGVILVAVLIAIGWHFFPFKPGIAASFTLEAVLSDSVGINPETSFILKSTQSLSESTIKKIVKFEPATDFSVKKTKLSSGFISSAIAQGSDENSIKSAFEIKPIKSLGDSDIYQVQIADTDYADHEYSWAFQVKAPFQVIQTHPRDKATSVPKNSGLEITFNRENLINPEAYFDISPKVEGSFKQQGKTLVFLPKALQEKTVYKVTIKKGLKNQDNDEALADDYSFVFETSSSDYSGGRPYFNLGNDFIEFLPDKKPTFEVSFYNIDPTSLNLDVYKFSNAEDFLNSYEQSRQWEWGWTSYYRYGYAGYNPAGQQKVLSFKPTVITVGYQNFVEVPQVLDQGYYLVDTTVGGRHEQAWLQVSPLARYFSISHDKSILWVYDFLKKEPVGGLKAFFVGGSAGAEIGLTDQAGLLQFATPDPLKSENKSDGKPKFLRVEKSGYRPFLIKVIDKWDWQQQASQGDLYWNYISSDRYVYQMNDTLRYWGIVKGRQEDLRQKKVKVDIYDQSYYWNSFWESNLSQNAQQPLVSQEVLVSQFDTIQGQLAFKGLAPGYYTLMVMLGDEIISTAGIQVMTFSRPVYQITVSPSRQTMYAGETVNFKVQASFFDGTPVSNLKLQYSGYWQNSFKGELILNQNGAGNVSYTPVYYEDNYVYYPRNLSLSFSPAMAEEGEIYGDASVLVFGPDLYLQASQEELSGDNYKFVSRLNKIVIDKAVPDDSGGFRNEYIGEAVKDYSLGAKIVKFTYRQVEVGEYYNPIDKVVRKRYDYHREDQEIETLSGATNSAGEWSFEKKLPREKDGYYEVTFFGQDPKGRKIKQTVYAGFSYYDQWKEFAASLSIGGEAYSKEYSSGERIKLQMNILSGEKPANAKVLFYRYQNNIDKVIVSDDLNFEENFDEKFIPSVQYRAVILSPYGFEETNSVKAYFRKLDRNLKVEIDPEKESYRPGDNIKINLSVKDKNSRPVKSEINVAAVDESLFHVLSYNWQPDILETLYSHIYVPLISGASQYNILKSKGAEGGGCFAAGTPILLADGSSKAIEKIKVGDQILTFEDENLKVLKPAIVQGISQHLVGGYLVINNSLKVTPEHKIYLNGRWDYAGSAKVGDVLVDAKGVSQRIYAINEQRLENTPVYNIVVGEYHTYFAGNYFVHNAEKGGEARLNFVDVALYETLQTDNSGQAQVVFKAPDNITSWRTTVLAFSSDTMQAGSNRKLISVSLPFFVDSTLSSYYLAGDNPYLRLRTAGVSRKGNEATEYSVESKTLNMNRKENSKEDNVFIQLGQLLSGEHELKISAKQGQLSDALIKKFKVVRSYFKKAEATFYNLSENLNSLEGNADGYTDLMFVDEGKGRFYSSLWQSSFVRGIRADQIAPNFFASKMLTQYFSEPVADEQLDLSGYQTTDGGMALFPYSDNDLVLSAQMADLAPEYISQNKLVGYFESSLVDKKADIHRVAKALYGLASLRQPVLAKINSIIKNNSELELEDKVYLGLGLAKIGDKENARRLYADAIRPQLRFQGSDAWLSQESDQTKQVKLTSAIAVLASYLNISGDKDALWNYVSTHSPERDLNTMEEVMIMKTELARAKDQAVGFSYQIGSEKKSIKIEKGQSYLMTLSADDLKAIKFSDISGKISLVSFYEKSQEPSELAKNQELAISRKYLVNGQATNSFSEESIVLVRLDPSIAASALDGVYQVVDYLPSGLRPITQIYEKRLSSGTNCDGVWYPSKIVDNAVYFTISKGFDHPCANRTINYYARAVSRGDFQANPALIQSMKDLNSLNVSAKDSVEIK